MKGLPFQSIFGLVALAWRELGVVTDTGDRDHMNKVDAIEGKGCFLFKHGSSFP